MRITDLSIEPSIAYIIARMIKMGYYNDVLLYEFHEEVEVNSHFNCLQGLDQFREIVSEFNSAFFQPSFVDSYPASIHLLMKLSNEWFIIHDCGANYYLGYGPQGIIELRKQCKFKGVKIIYNETNIKEFIDSELKKKVDKTQDEYEQIIKALVLYGIGLERQKKSFSNLKEENIRNIMLPALNTIFEGRVYGEAVNVKGKTDILLREKDGKLQYIFELKVWNSIKKFEEGCNQLLGYLSYTDNKAGMLIFSNRKSLSGVIKKTKKYFVEKKAEFITLDKTREKEYRIEVEHPCDNQKRLILHLFFIDIS